jgi:arylsulfatase A-like enzyme
MPKPYKYSFVIFVFVMSFVLGSLVGAGANVRAADKPNIVFFFIDDMGWTDLGFMGSKYYESPNIDRLAGEGMVFDSAYANAPNCAPSRACLMSGQYGPRHGIFTVGDPKRGNHAHRKLEPTPNKTVLDDKFITLGESLQAGGYKTATMGKWHLGADPTTQGFDVNIAGKTWGSPSGGGYHSPLNYPNLVVKEKGVYLTDALTDKAVEFIEKNKSKPFFLYLTHYAVHTPIQAKDDLRKKYQAKKPSKSHKNAKYAAMIESVDDSVGRVLATLERLKLSDNTVVIFFSDNGGHVGATSNFPLRGYKGMLYEGGIREPFIMKWPGQIKAGSTNSTPIIGIDLYPTLLEITGTQAPKGYTLDGESIVPLLTGKGALKRDAIFWHFPCYLQGSGDPRGPFRTTPAGAIRLGDYKLIEFFEDGELQLYNIKKDISEKTNLVDSMPDKVKQLHARMKAWRKEVNAPVPTTPNPKYKGSGQTKGKAKGAKKKK